MRPLDNSPDNNYEDSEEAQAPGSSNGNNSEEDVEDSGFQGPKRGRGGRFG